MSKEGEIGGLKLNIIDLLSTFIHQKQRRAGTGQLESVCLWGFPTCVYGGLWLGGAKLDMSCQSMALTTIVLWFSRGFEFGSKWRAFLCFQRDQHEKGSITAQAHEEE
ncbi:hypothetical protein HYC85_011024 [Camellia sinensis]|uniref:Uncharacterized protein n=1 Tax=Camellia sinensis TaxID=4442 RepID=A0A7J7HJK6_CAMSI|nr:hypothetical protein HYC85_011024 [Camellia sinensis]